LVGVFVSYPLYLMSGFFEGIEAKWLAYLFGIPFWVFICFTFCFSVQKGKLYGGLGKGLIVRTSTAILSTLYVVLVFIAIFAYEYIIYGVEDANGKIYHDIKTAVYFSTITFTTLGYGDLRPTEAARGLAALEAILGYLTFGVIIGVLVYFLSCGWNIETPSQKKHLTGKN